MPSADGSPTYTPTNSLTRWLDNRLPILRTAHAFLSFPTPRNLNYLWTFGAILSFILIVQIVTGIALSMHYTAHVDFAFDSVEKIMRDVNYGWMLRYIHANGASMFFIAIYLHMLRALYFGSYKAPRELLWLIGVAIYLLAILTAFLGYVLPWGQMSYWAATVITNLASAIPFIGDPIRSWLWGGFAVGNPTLNRFFVLHYLMPFIIIGLVGLHVWALHVVRNNNPLGVEVRDIPNETVPFHPYYTVKDSFALMAFLLLFAALAFYAPNYLGHADNYIRANPLVTPEHIVPEWYFLHFYAILRAIPSKLGGVIVMGAAVAVLFLVPWLDSSRIRSARYRPLYKWFFWVFVLVCLGLGWVGSQSPDHAIIQFAQSQDYSNRAAAEATIANPLSETIIVESYHGGQMVYQTVTPYFRFDVTDLGRILTVLYFVFFLIVMPLLGLIEKPDPIPTSIRAARSAPNSSGS